MTTLRAALCGLGNIAWRFDRHPLGRGICLSHAGAYQRQEETVLVAGFSPVECDRDAFQQTFSLPAYKNIDELFAHEKPDVVSICSPSPVHFEQTMACLEHAVPMIWLEKPPTLTLAEADMLLEKAATGKNTVVVNYQRRYLPVYQELRRRFLAQEMGACQQIHATYSRGLETNGSHILDMLFFLVGDHVEPRVKWVDGDPENPTFGMALGGIDVMVTGLALPYHNIDISVTGDQGRLSILHGGMTAVVERKVEHEVFPGFYRLQTMEDQGFSALAGLDNGMENALQDLLDSHVHCRPPVSGLQSARQAMALVEEVRRWQTERGGR